MLAELRVKQLSLGAEGRIIRREEQRWLARARKGRDNLALAQINGRSKEIREKVEAGIVGAAAAWASLRDHRLKELRPEARSTNIAYGFFKGRAYAEIEGDAYTSPSWIRVEEIARKFFPGGVPKGSNFGLFSAWKAAAETWLAENVGLRKSGKMKDKTKPRPVAPRGPRRTRAEWEAAQHPDGSIDTVEDAARRLAQS